MQLHVVAILHVACQQHAVILTNLIGCVGTKDVYNFCSMQGESFTIKHLSLPFRDHASNRLGIGRLPVADALAMAAINAVHQLLKQLPGPVLLQTCQDKMRGTEYDFCMWLHGIILAS